jgi:hypothetical protein
LSVRIRWSPTPWQGWRRIADTATNGDESDELTEDPPVKPLPIPPRHTGSPPARLGPAIPAELWRDDLTRLAPLEPAWLWQGYLVAGGVTLLTSQWKAGKTTLVSVLLGRLKAGGTLAGLPVAAGKAVVVSEEGPDQWEPRARKLDLTSQVCWLCRPFAGKPGPDEWLALLDRLAELGRRHGLGLAVIDPLAAFLPGRNENNAATMLEALTPLHRLTRQGMAVLLVHHPRKKDGAAGLAARGSGALPAFVDTQLELDWSGRGATADRRRRLRGLSRYDATPRELVVELTADGTDYVARGDFAAEEFGSGWDRLRMVLEDAHQKLTRRHVLAEWPPDFAKPHPATLWEWLEEAVTRGLACRDGTGRKGSPFRYWLAGQEARWRGDPLHLPDLPELPPVTREETCREAELIVRRAELRRDLAEEDLRRTARSGRPELGESG